MANCGIDIIEISRISSAIEKNPQFLNKVFSDEEISYSFQKQKAAESLAGFFAAKEAYLKYTGEGIKKSVLPLISVGHTDDGQPFLSAYGKKLDVSLSISHNNETAVAVVCGKDMPLVDNPLKDEMKSLMPNFSEDAHKNDKGHVLVIAGSEGMSGAAALSAYSALRTGAGLVTLATAECERKIAAGFYPEIMTRGLKDQNGIISEDCMGEILRLAENKKAIAFGPGLGRKRAVFTILEELLKTYKGKLVIDADGLNALSKNPEILKNSVPEVVITPHPGEMSRLTGKSIDEISKNRQKVALEFAKEYKITVVLKGSGTVVAKDKIPAFVNPTGNQGMATAGSGDVLTGVIAGLLAQGMSAFDAARLGVYLHGLSGDIVKTKKGVHSLIASDIIETMPDAIMEILK